MKRKETKDDYERYLNDMYYHQDIWMNGVGRYSYMNAPRLLKQGKLGTALRRHDPIAFNVGYREWKV